MKKAMRVAGWLSALVLTLGAFAAMAWAEGTPIVFDLPQDKDPSQVFVQFINTDHKITGSYVTPEGATKSLAINVAYSMADITGKTSVGGGAPQGKPAVMVTSFASGRVYVNYGKTGLAGLGGSYQPAAQVATDPNYKARYQYFEPQITGNQCSVDMSYIDFFSISMSMEAKNAGNASNSPQNTVKGSRAIAIALKNSASTPGDNVIQSATKLPPDAEFARVIAPQLRGDLYHDWSHYLKTSLQGKTVRLAGCFNGVGAQPSATPETQQQSYDFTAVFDADGNAKLTARTGSGNGKDGCVDSKLRGTGVGANVTISIPYSQLTKITGVYGNDTGYTVDNNGVKKTTANITNDYYGWVVGDLLAGLSWGFPGSSVKFGDATIGELGSTQWWGNGKMPGGVNVIKLKDTPLGQGLCFDKAQPGQPLNYHAYAAALADKTPAYGFALADRQGNNLMSFNTGDPKNKNSYLLITLNADGMATSRKATSMQGVYLLLEPQ